MTTTLMDDAFIMTTAKDMILKLKPAYPCRNCGTNNWWWRPDSEYGSGEWICGKCHPNPNPDIDINMPFEVEAK